MLKTFFIKKDRPDPYFWGVYVKDNESITMYGDYSDYEGARDVLKALRRAEDRVNRERVAERYPSWTTAVSTYNTSTINWNNVYVPPTYYTSTPESTRQAYEELGRINDINPGCTCPICTRER